MANKSKRQIRLEREVERLRCRLIKVQDELRASNKKARQMSFIDIQTGLFNHQYLQRDIEAELRRCQRFAYPVSLIVLDIDYFKSVNDLYGRVFGDFVLKQLAGELKDKVRVYDTVARLGGGEFVVLLPSTDGAGALVLSRRLLDSFNLYNFGDKSRKVKLKLSFAVTAYPEDGVVNTADLLNLAQKILNRAKEAGGNRVYSYADLEKLEEDSREIGRRSDVGSLKSKLEKMTKKTNQGLVESIFALAKTIEVKDHYTGEHAENTVRYATGIARKLNLSDNETELVRQAAILHDLGKIGISERILLKKSKLTKDEFAKIKKHPYIAADILRPIQALHDVIPLIFYHHERWDGKGYPGSLKAQEIPLGARIIAIADVYQAMTSRRPYRKAYSKKKALKIIKSGTGTQFDPQIVRVFTEVLNKEK